MKKLSLVLVLLIISAATWAQPTDTVRIHVNGSEMIIITENWDEVSKTDFNAIIKKTNAEAKGIEDEHKRRMAEVDRKLANGKMTDEEAADERAMIAEDTTKAMEELAENVERWADEYGQKADENTADVDEWASAWEQNAEKYESTNPPPDRVAPTDEDDDQTNVIIDEDGIHIHGQDWDPEDVKEATRRYKGKKTHGYFEMYFGLNNWFDQDGLAKNVDDRPLTTTELNFWPSTTWGFGLGGRTRFGQSKFLIRYGAQFNWHYFRLKGDNLLEKTITDDLNGEPFNGTTIRPHPELNVSKTTFRINYVDVPVMFEFDNSAPGRSNGFSFGLGGYGGLRLNSHALVFSSDKNGDRTKTKTRNNYYANGYRYGAMAQIGFGTFKITGKFDLDYLFRADRTTPDYQVGSLTFGWVFP